VLDAGKEQDLLNMSGSPNRVLPLPQVVVAHEEYAMFDRLLRSGASIQLEVNIDKAMTTDSVPQWNTVAEIRGTEHPGEVVIVGAHLDSWDFGTGATDNGTGAMCTSRRRASSRSRGSGPGAPSGLFCSPARNRASSGPASTPRRTRRRRSRSRP